MYSEGISKIGSLIDLAVEHKILVKRGAWVSYEGDLIGQGRQAAKQYLSEHPQLQEELTNAIFKKVNLKRGNSIASGKGGEDEG